jgi:hypothetical protein
MPKSGAVATNRKNSQVFILREGSDVAMLFGLPSLTKLECFSPLNIGDTNSL